MPDHLLDSVAHYYTEKLHRHGATPAGVDWNGEASQHLRFAQFCQLFPRQTPFSLIDLGCGYGALYDYLHRERYRVQYLGLDIAAAMIDSARALHSTATDARFAQGDSSDTPADFAVASGVLNVRNQIPMPDWQAYVLDVIAKLDHLSTRGFAFNCLTSYSDADKMRDYLYYADPCQLFDHCKRHYARDVALLHDYGLYEFTLIVRKSLATPSPTLPG